MDFLNEKLSIWQMFILKGGKEAMNYEETKSKLDKMWEKIKPWRALVDGEGHLNQRPRKR